MKKQTTARPCVHRVNSGFTLIEVLVAVVVLGVGILGVGKLVLSSVKSNDSAYLRSQALELAYAMLDQMRANRQGVLNGDYAASTPIPMPSPSQCGTSSCNSTQIALADIYQWQVFLTSSLPAGQGQVSLNSIGNQVTATVSVTWDDSPAARAFGGTSASAATPVPVTVTLVSII